MYQTAVTFNKNTAEFGHSWIFLRFFIIITIIITRIKKIEKSKMDKSTETSHGESSIVLPPGAWQLSANLSRTIRSDINELAKNALFAFHSVLCETIELAIVNYFTDELHCNIVSDMERKN